MCLENYYDCYAEIGGVDWLPAYAYLPGNATVSVEYFVYGICNEDSTLYNSLHCEVCTGNRRHRMAKVPSWRRHGWPPRAPPTASEGLRPPPTLVRRNLASQVPPGGRGNGAIPCPRHRFRRV